MGTAERVQERIQMFDKRLERLRAERDRLMARASQAERRRDTRRKIIIGGTVLAAIGADGVPAMRSQADLARWLDARLERPFDRAVFDLSRHQSA
jgi:hypothetical protein